MRHKEILERKIIELMYRVKNEKDCTKDEIFKKLEAILCMLES